MDRFYLHSFEILLACTVVFPGVGNVGYTLLEYRLGQRNFFDALIENLRWVPFLCVLLPLIFPFVPSQTIFSHVLNVEYYIDHFFLTTARSSLAGSAFIYLLRCLHTCSRTICECSIHPPESHRLSVTSIPGDLCQTLGRGDPPEKKLSVRRSGLKVRTLSPMKNTGY